MVWNMEIFPIESVVCEEEHSRTDIVDTYMLEMLGWYTSGKVNN